MSSALIAAVASTLAASPPNILFILADDLGYNELNFMNGTRGIITPHLDALAKGGVTLKNYYVQPICTPTRSALMTGRYTIRLGTQSSVIYWDTPWAIPVNETFIGQNLKTVGYNTAMFGKWHLGMFKQAYTPAQRGFDEHMGYYQGCESAYTHIAACCTAGSPDHDHNFVCKPGHWGKKDYRGYDWWKTGAAPNDHVSKPDFSVNHTNSAYLIRDAAINFLGRQKEGTPWFLYLPFQNIHSPYTADQKYHDMYDPTKFTPGEQTIFGYLTEMDDAVGEIVAAMASNGFTDNTVIMFSSDNGAPPDGNDVDHPRTINGIDGYIARNHPFRGWKTQIWEGGTRVAGFISSPLLPGAVKGTVSGELMHVTDWLPTIAAISGASTEKNHPLDGHNMWDVLSTGAENPRTEILYGVNPLDSGQAGYPKAAIRIGKYKLISWAYEVAGINGSTHTGPINSTVKESKEFSKGPVLFDLDADPEENVNIAAQNAGKVAAMLLRLGQLAGEMVEPMQWTRPFQGDDYFCKDCPLAPGGQGPATPWAPWVQ